MAEMLPRAKPGDKNPNQLSALSAAAGRNEGDDGNFNSRCDYGL